MALGDDVPRWARAPQLGRSGGFECTPLVLGGILEAELRDIIERRRAQAVWQAKDGQRHFSDYVFHHEGNR